MVDPEFGELVAVTLRGRRVYGGDEWTHNVGAVYIVAEGEPLVEILEQAEDPARDPLGTVRKAGDDGRSFVKLRPNVWSAVLNSNGSPLLYQDCELNGRPIIGAVPGTPAAEAASPPDQNGNQWPAD